MTTTTNKTYYNPTDRIWSGRNRKPFKYSGLSVGQVFFKQMKSNPQNIFQISDSDGTHLTNAEMLKISIRIAQNLNTAHGHAQGIMVGMMATCSTYQPPVLYACLLNGTVFHAINPKCPKSAVRYLFGLTRPEIMFCDAENYETLAAACKDINLKAKFYTISGCIEGVPNVQELMKDTGKEDTFCPRDCSNDEFDTVAIVCSSGTTGLPKGIFVSHLRAMELFSPFEAGSIIFTFSNVDWVSGLGFFVCNILSSTTRICTTATYSPQKLRELIEKYKVNYCVMSGLYLSQFVKSGEAELCDCSSLRQFIAVGGTISHPMFVKMESLIKCGLIANYYGGTEFGAVSSTTSSAKARSAGQLLDGIKVRIVNEEGVNLAVGQSGEILVKNESKWRGYINNPVETEKMFDKDAWFHTGDVGFIDEDGDLYLVDRKKHIIQCMGSGYSPQEIEDCILELSSVAEVCVFGVRSEKLGDLPTALVKRKAGSNTTREEIENYVKQKLSKNRWLHGGLFFVDDIPRNTNGKYVQTKAKEKFNELKCQTLA